MVQFVLGINSSIQRVHLPYQITPVPNFKSEGSNLQTYQPKADCTTCNFPTLILGEEGRCSPFNSQFKSFRGPRQW